MALAKMGQDDSNLLRDAARQLQHNLNSLLASQDLVTAEDRRKLRLSIDQVQCHLVAPEEKAFEIVNTVHMLLALFFLIQQGVFEKIPSGSPGVSVEDISTMHPNGIRYATWLQHLSTNGFFHRKGDRVWHNKTSLHFCDPHARETIVFTALITLQIAASWVADPSPMAGSVDDELATPFHCRFGTKKPFFEYLATVPTLFDAFNGMMTYYAENGSMKVSDLRCYPWESLGPATVVDVGGNTGQLARFLVESYPDLRLTVQDLPTVIRTVEESHNEQIIETRGKVAFLAHDFRKVQTEQADVFLLRFILHDYPRSMAVKILKNLRAGLRPESRILIIDIVLDLDHRNRRWQRDMTAMDCQLGMMLNGRERTWPEWQSLILEACGPCSVERYDTNVLSLLEVRLSDRSGLSISKGLETLHTVETPTQPATGGIDRRIESELAGKKESKE